MDLEYDKATGTLVITAEHAEDAFIAGALAAQLEADGYRCRYSGDEDDDIVLHVSLGDPADDEDEGDCDEEYDGDSESQAHEALMRFLGDFMASTGAGGPSAVPAPPPPDRSPAEDLDALRRQATTLLAVVQALKAAREDS